MRLLLLANAAALLAGCGSASVGPSAPSVADIERLEAALAKHPCVGDIEGWERSYRFGMTARRFWPGSNHPNLDLIEFHLRRVGDVSIKPGRVVVPIGSDGWPDSAPIRRLDGSFNVKNGRVGLPRCRGISRP